MPVNDTSDKAATKPQAPPTNRPDAAFRSRDGALRTGRRSPPAVQPEHDMRLLLFDADWYLRQHEDVARARLDPVQHYLDHGAGEGRNPNAFFDTRRYLAANADVRTSPLNPFLHFVLYGFREGRDPSPPIGTMADTVPAEAPAEEKLRRTLLAAMFAAAAEAEAVDNPSDATPVAPDKASARPTGRSGPGARKKPRPV